MRTFHVNNDKMRYTCLISPILFMLYLYHTGLMCPACDVTACVRERQQYLASWKAPPTEIIICSFKILWQKYIKLGTYNRYTMSIQTRTINYNHSLTFKKKKKFIVCFTSYFVFSIAVLPHSPGVVYYHQLLRRETRIPGVAPFSL